MLAGLLLGWAGLASAQCTKGVAAGKETGVNSAEKHPQLVWIDTDIGDDIDDAFALGLALEEPRLRILGISTAFGDTELRARLVDRFLAEGKELHKPGGIAVTAGVHTQTDNVMTQAAYAKGSPEAAHPDGVAALLKQIRLHPGQITLIAIGPLFNVGAMIDRDPKTFRKLRRVVMMGGSIHRGYDGENGELRPADAEWNINRDPKDAEKLMEVGVPIFMMPLDSTQIHLDAGQRETLFSEGSKGDPPVIPQIEELYKEWVANTASHSPTPTLFDPVAVAYAVEPGLCPMEAMRLKVDEKGFTLPIEGKPNVEVCLKSDEAGFRSFLVPRLRGETGASCK
jgi:inosine-uridine nucleoside N-ribohydrolase